MPSPKIPCAITPATPEEIAAGKWRWAVKAEVMSRVVGYYSGVQNWNIGKQEEFKDRKTYKFPDMEALDARERVQRGS